MVINPFTGGSAAISAVPEAYQPQALQNLQQQRMAQLLMQQGQQTPQGQMISGHYVKPSPFQNLASVANQALGMYAGYQADKGQVDLAKAIREGERSAMADYMQTKEGRAAVDGGVAVPANAKAAYANLFADPRASAKLQEFAFNKLNAEPEAFTLTEGAKRFINMPDGTVKEVAAGGQKPRSPISVGNYLVDPESGKVIFQAPEKPTAGQVVERDDGTFLVNTRTGQATPVMGQGGQPLQGGGKPLTEVQGNAVGFAARAIEANRIATDLEKQGVRNTGAIRTALGGVAGMTPFIGEELEQGVRSVFNVAPSFVGGASTEQQKVEQARRDFVSAILRPESGAAIGVQEAKNEEKKYFPQAGDSDEVIGQKQQARLKAIEGLKAKAGPSGVRQINRIVEQGGGGGVVDFNQLPTGNR